MKNLQDDMMDLMDVSNEIQESLGRNYSVPDDIDEEDLMGGKCKFTVIFLLQNYHCPFPFYCHLPLNIFSPYISIPVLSLFILSQR